MEVSLRCADSTCDVSSTENHNQTSGNLTRVDATTTVRMTQRRFLLGSTRRLGVMPQGSMSLNAYRHNQWDLTNILGPRHSLLSFPA